jgi:hypothetical protein
VNVSQAPRSQNECSIAIAPDRPLNVVVTAHDYRSGFKHVGVWASFDGGRTFKGGPVANLGVHGFEGDPSLAAHRRGVFYLGYIDHSDDGNRVAVARSSDGGLSWPSVTGVIDHAVPSQGFEDKPYIAVDDTGGAFDGNVYLTWVRLAPDNRARIRFARSENGAQSFETSFLTSNGGPAAFTGPVPVVGPEGELYVAWKAPGTTQFTRSLDGGVTFPPPIVVHAQAILPDPLPGALFRVSPFPTLAVDRSTGPARGTLYLAWADRLGLGAGPDILLVRSDDRGATWSEPVRVSDDVEGAYQFFPWMCVGPDGVVNVVFLDQRNAPNSPRYDAYLARSLDGGRTFEPNLRLSDEITDTSLDTDFLGTFIGDYIGIAASPLGVYPVWNDLRASLGQMEIMVRPLRPLGR